MRIEYTYKRNLFGFKKKLILIDFEGQQKELEKLLQGMKVVEK